jgi:hypothetical protein
VSIAEPQIAPLTQPASVTSRAGAVDRPTRISYGIFAVPAIIVALRFLPPPVNDAAYALTFIYALTGRRQAVIALFLLSLLNIATHAFGLPPALAALYRHPIVAAAAFSTLVLHNARGSRLGGRGLVSGTLLVCSLILVHSLLLSQMPTLSVLKALSFTMAILALLAGWSRLSDEERRKGEAQLWGLVGGLAVLSAPMLATPLGYLRGTMGFQGLTTQAQAFGPMMAVFATFLWMLVISGRKLTLGLIGLTCMATCYVYLSQARVGAATLVIGLFAGVGLAPLIPVLNRIRLRPRVHAGRIAVLGAVVLFGLIVAGGLLVSKAKNFLIKYGSADETTSFGDVTDAVYRARGGAVDRMLASIKQRPLTGIGFGVPTEGGLSSEIVYDPVFGLPIMAAVEKGVMPVALLEELGIPLALLVFAWLAWLFWLAAKGGAISLALFSATLGVNVAESCFFSPGGGGLFFLVIACMAATAHLYLPASSAKSNLQL